jgi:hypothetical protein
VSHNTQRVLPSSFNRKEEYRPPPEIAENKKSINEL